MKKQILIIIVIFSSIVSCKVLKKKETVKPVFEIFNDTVSNKLFISSQNINQINKNDLENHLKIKIKGKNEKILNGESIQYIEKNKIKNLTISIYSKNLIKQNSETSHHWKTSNSNAIINNKGSHYFNIKKDEQIGQTICFKPFDFSNKYLVFIGNAKAEKFVKKSITGQPYLWGYQIGDFKKEDWVFMQSPHNVRTSDDENYWEKIYIVNKLLNNISSTYVRMSLGLRKNESKGNARATLTDLNLRIFNSKEDAMFFVEKIFKRKSLITSCSYTSKIKSEYQKMNLSELKVEKGNIDKQISYLKLNFYLENVKKGKSRYSLATQKNKNLLWIMHQSPNYPILRKQWKEAVKEYIAFENKYSPEIKKHRSLNYKNKEKSLTNRNEYNKIYLPLRNELKHREYKKFIYYENNFSSKLGEMWYDGGKYLLNFHKSRNIEIQTNWLNEKDLFGIENYSNYKELNQKKKYVEKLILRK